VTDNADVLLNQLIHFYLNSVTDLHHLTSHGTPCCPQHRDCNVTSLHPCKMRWTVCCTHCWMCRCRRG